MRAHAAALAFRAARLVAVVYAKGTRWRALAAVVLDFVVRANIRPLAFPKLCVRAWAHFMAGSVNAPANPPPRAVMAEYAAATFTTLSLQFVMSTPRIAFASLARTTLSSMLTHPCTFAVFAEVLFAAVDAKSAAATRATLGFDSSVQTYRGSAAISASTTNAVVLTYAAASLVESFALAAAAFGNPMLAKSAAAAGFAKVLDFSVGASRAALFAVGALPKMNAFTCGWRHVASLIPARAINRHCKHIRVTPRPLAAAALHWHATQKTR